MFSCLATMPSNDQQHPANSSMIPLASFLLIICLSITFTLSQYTTKDHAFSSYIANGLIIAQLLAASVAMIVLLCSRVNTQQTASDNRRHHIIDRLKLLAIIVFFFLGVSLEFLQFMSMQTCWKEVHNHCYNLTTKADYQSEVIYCFSKILYMIFVLIFCILYHIRRLYKSHTQLMLMGLAVVQSANLAIWFDSVLDESELFSLNFTLI